MDTRLWRVHHRALTGNSTMSLHAVDSSPLTSLESSSSASGDDETSLKSSASNDGKPPQSSNRTRSSSDDHGLPFEVNPTSLLLYEGQRISVDYSRFQNTLTRLLFRAHKLHTLEWHTYAFIGYILEHHCLTAYDELDPVASYSVNSQPGFRALGRKGCPDFATIKDQAVNGEPTHTPGLIWEAKRLNAKSWADEQIKPLLHRQFLSDYPQLHRYALTILRQYPDIPYIRIAYSIGIYFVSLKFSMPVFDNESAIPDADRIEFFHDLLPKRSPPSSRDDAVAASSPLLSAHRSPTI
ncbi:hypothetical protein BV25DRAFT_1900221 [Artomyces pyxidatus]|uniref:Uncharacterized protein n=1 Tax=Artomyces pyxidatus TaxID=48021 RepID=A0ACB8T0A8_9AGAM|nr:hypothetical protein BV25DRAFT_1900221 [Artomyces pyxidatus]